MTKFGISQIGNKPPLWLERLTKAYVYFQGAAAPIVAMVPSEAFDNESKIWLGVGAALGLVFLETLLIFTGKDPSEVK